MQWAALGKVSIKSKLLPINGPLYRRFFVGVRPEFGNICSARMPLLLVVKFSAKLQYTCYYSTWISLTYYSWFIFHFGKLLLACCSIIASIQYTHTSSYMHRTYSMCVEEMTLIPEMFDGEEGGGSLQYENVCPHQGQTVSLRLPAQCTWIYACSHQRKTAQA